MNEAEKELNIEQQMFSRNENVNLILKQNIVSYIYLNSILFYFNYVITIFIGIYRNFLIIV